MKLVVVINEPDDSAFVEMMGEEQENGLVLHQPYSRRLLEESIDTALEEIRRFVLENMRFRK